MEKIIKTQPIVEMPIDEKKNYLEKAANLWDKLNERQKGRLEGKLEALEQFALEERTA